jgi:hypothetical protein
MNRNNHAKKKMMMNNKSGQAALEFLTTYGWAILVVMVMIGALAYFGVMNPQNLVPEKCIFSSGIGCRDYAGLVTAHEVRAKLMNGFGYTIQIQTASGVVVDSSGTTNAFEPCGATNSWCNLTVGGTDWKSGVEKEFVVNYPNGLGASDRPQVLVTIKYNKAGSTYTKEITGQVLVKPG